VPAVQHQQPLVSGLVQPQPEGHRLTPQEVGQAAEDLQFGLLHHVGRVDARPEPRVEAAGDEGAQGGLVAGAEPLEGPPAAGAGLPEQLARLGRVVRRFVHGASP
jgi:hypothetical protein